MKKRYLLLIPTLLAIFCVSSCGGSENIVTSKDTGSELTSTIDTSLSECVFTSFAAQDFNGKAVNQSIFSDHKVTMINVWATWCKPCVTEMPYLAKLHKKYQESGFQVIGVALDCVDINYNKDYEKFNTAKQIIAETQANYTHLLPSKSMKNFIDGIETVPQTIFVNEEGYLVGNVYKGIRTESEWETLITTFLELL